MSADRKFDRTISGWLEAEAPGRLPDRVLSATFERTRRTRQRRGWGALLGRFQMNRLLLPLGGAVALVAAIAILNSIPGIPGVGGTSPRPSPTATAQPPSVTPTPSDEASLVEGPFLLWEEAGMTVTIPGPGWHTDPGRPLLARASIEPPDGAGMILFGLTDQFYVYGDPCRWSTTRPETPATTVDELVAALAAQASRDASDPVDVTVDGHQGKSITLHVPDDANFAECDQGLFGSWAIGGDPSPSRVHQGRGQIDKLWILDVAGELIVIDAGHYAGTPAEIVDQLDAIVESATFE